MRLKFPERREQILRAAYSVAKKSGYAALTRKEVSGLIGVTPPLINYYYPTLNHLKAAVMRRAVNESNCAIVAQGLAMQDKTAKRAPPALKRKALKVAIGE